MTLRFYISRDAGAVAVGADDVAVALEKAAETRNIAIEIIRTGSRGLYWLEPMVEIATPKGRIAFGPVTVEGVASVLDAASSDGPHALRLGLADEIPWLKRQTRLTFARCGVSIRDLSRIIARMMAIKVSTARCRLARTEFSPT